MRRPTEAPEVDTKKTLTLSIESTSSFEEENVEQAKPGIFNLRYREFDSEPQALSAGKAVIIFCFNPATKRYVCRPIIRPGVTVILLFVTTVMLTCLASWLRVLGEKGIHCDVKYPSFDKDATTEELNMLAINYPWVTLGDKKCDLKIDDCYREDLVTIGPANCIGLDDDDHYVLPSPVVISYLLEPFYQMHRRYVLSRDYLQLTGAYDMSSGFSSYLSSCSPLKTLADLHDQYGFLDEKGNPPPGYPKLDNIASDHSSVLLHPCGLQAFSVFNDTFEVFSGAHTIPTAAPDTDHYNYGWHGTTSQEKVDFVSYPDRISIKPDREYYKNADKKDRPKDADGKFLVYEWMPNFLSNPKDAKEGKSIENAHFMNWMRLSPYSSTRKLYAVLRDSDSTLKLPLTVMVKNRYSVSAWNGTKSINLSAGYQFSREVSTVFFCLAASCLVITVVFGTKLKLKPRRLGDIRYLNT